MEEQFHTLFNAIELEDIDLFKAKWSLKIANSWHDPKGGRCLLHEAVALGRVEFIQFMLENGADPNVRTRGWRDTPMTLEGSLRRVDRTKISILLLRYGGNPCLADKRTFKGDNTDYFDSYLLVGLVCGEADNLSLGIWKAVKPFIYNI